MRLIDTSRLLVWAGRRRNRPITYEDLVDAETRCFNAEENLAELTSACKQWRDATESRLRHLDSRGEAAKSMLPADRVALCEAIDGVES